MPNVILSGHDYFYPVSDVMRLYYESVREEGNMVTAGDPDITICSKVADGVVSTEWNRDGVFHRLENPATGIYLKREVKRQLYQALTEITGLSFPWGSLTGIRPTLIAAECNNQPEILQDHYFVSKSKALLASETSLNEQNLQTRLLSDSIHCYVGIPFCPSRCLYCSFISSEYNKNEAWTSPYVDALIKEISACLPVLKNKLQTLYIGGGTPTALNDVQFERLLCEISRHLDGERFEEFTVEAGRADSITEKKLAIMKKYGVDRICINPQTLQDKTLVKIGRNHTAEQVIAAYQLAKQFHFNTINMDLIAGLPGEDFHDFKDTLDRILVLRPENITVHTLSLKRTSSLCKIIKEEKKDEAALRNFHMPNREISDMIEYSIEQLHKNGYHPYYLYRQKDMAGGHENTGYSLPGHENLYNVAMMGDKSSVIAFGSGAMSKRAYSDGNATRLERCPNLKDVREYISRIDEMIDNKCLFFETSL